MQILLPAKWPPPSKHSGSPAMDPEQHRVQGLRAETETHENRTALMLPGRHGCDRFRRISLCVQDFGGTPVEQLVLADRQVLARFGVHVELLIAHSSFQAIDVECTQISEISVVYATWLS